MPWVIGFLAFSLIPMASSLYISALKWDGLTEKTFVGLGNYIKLLGIEKQSTTSVLFWRSMQHNLLFMLFSGFGGLVLSLLMAAIMNEKVRGHNFFRVLFFLPSLTVPVAFGLMMQPIFAQGAGSGYQTGVINWFVTLFGGKEINFLGDPKLGIWTMIIISYWTVGSGMIVFMAGIAGLPKSYYEAAQLDGAGWWSRFFNVTVPLLTPVLFFQTIMALIGGLRILDLAVSLAGMGDPTKTNMGANDSLATLVFFLYKKGFRDWKMGEAAAIGWFIFLIGLVFTVAILVYMRRQNNDGAAGVEGV
jgi:multiple sugar transport system permease protein